MELNEEIIFKVGVDSNKANKAVSELDKEFKDLDKTTQKQVDKMRQLGEAIEGGEMSMRDMSKAIKDYQTIAINAGRETPVGQYAIKQAANLTDKIGDLRNEINRAAHDGKNLQGAMQLGSGLIAGYGAFAGVQALVGKENENLQKTFVKLQAVQSLLMGVEQIRAMLEKESSAMMLIKTARTKILTTVQLVYAAAVGTTTGAMKAMRLAMMALPIVAIIAGITALIVWIVKLAGSSEDLGKANTDLKASYDSLTASMDRHYNAMKRQTDRQIELAKAQGASAEEILSLEKGKYKQLEEMRKDSLRNEASFISQQRVILNKARKEGDTEVIEQSKTELKAHQDKYKDLVEQQSEFIHQKELLDVNYQNGVNDSDAKQQEKQLQAQKANSARSQQERDAAKQLALEREKLYQDLVVANIANANEREIAELAKNQQRELDLVKEKYGEKAKLVTELEQKQATEMMALIDAQDLAFQTQQDEIKVAEIEKAKAATDREFADKKANAEARLLQMYLDFEAEQAVKAELAQIELDTLLLNDKLTADEKLLIQEQYNAKIRGIEQETTDHNIALKEKEINNAMEWAAKSVNAIGGLTDAYFANKSKNLVKGSKEEKAMALKQFKIQKALMLTMAGIDAIKAVTTSLSMSPIAIGPIPNPAGIASLAFAVAGGVSSIAKIAAMQFTGGNSGASAASVAPPSVNVPTVQPQNVPNGVGTLTAGLAGSGNQTTVKAVITDSDLKEGLNNYEQGQSVGSFG
jgi:hypothetical protein